MGQYRVRRQINGETYLDDEDVNGVLRVVSGGIGSLEDASLAGGSDDHGDRRLRWWC